MSFDVTIGGSSTPALQYGESKITSATGAAYTLTQFNNLTSLSLGAGTYMLSALAAQVYVASLTDWALAISTNSGDTTTDHVNGVNQVGGRLGINTLYAGGAAITDYLLVLAATTTVYAKIKVAGATGDIFTGKLSYLKVA